MDLKINSFRSHSESRGRGWIIEQMVWGLLANHWEENKVNDQHHTIDQNKFLRLNIYMLKKKKL